MITLYIIRFTPPGGSPLRMDTTDAGKIGPWLAEMFGLFPYTPTSPDPVRVEQSKLNVV